MLRRSLWFMLLVLLFGFVSWQPRSGVVLGRTPVMCAGGTGTLSNGPYDWVNSQFYYNVTGAPASVCGTLHTFRNGSQLDSPSWICTNSSGNATMGPYSGSTNQTDENTYIEWPNGCTTNTVRHISDASPPTISIGSCCSSFSGTATDVQWGTGFDFGPFGWSGVTMTYQDLSTGKYWDGSGYNSTSPINNGGSSSDFFGMTIHWSTSFPPPSSAHNASDSYRWCVWTNDFFYQSNIACQGFTGIP